MHLVICSKIAGAHKSPQWRIRASSEMRVLFSPGCGLLLNIAFILKGFLSLFSEYLGCYTIFEENRVFLSSPGDYDMQDMSPLHCLRQCGRKYRYATLQEGNICLCANSLPTAGKVDDSECNLQCPGHETWPSEAQASLK